MATLKTSNDIAQQLRSLVPDLPRYCTRIVLTLEVGSIPEVVATFHPEVDTAMLSDMDRRHASGAITQRYQLIPIE